MTGVKTESKPFKPKAVMILAAGLGERMRPLTNDIPKALVEINQRPLIAHTLDLISSLNPEKIVINLHYKPDPLIVFLKTHPLWDRIILSDETMKLLDTGGGVKKALSHLGQDPFLVTNCDAFFPKGANNPYLDICDQYQEGVALLLHQRKNAIGYSGKGDFFLEKDGNLRRKGEAPEAPFVFTGVQVLHPALFEGVTDEKFSLNAIYDRALQNNTLKGIKSRTPWFHIGTPGALAEAETVLGKS